MPNSNTNNILLVPRLRTTNLLHANTDTGEGLLCYHKSLTQWKKLITITLYAFFFQFSNWFTLFSLCTIMNLMNYFTGKN